MPTPVHQATTQPGEGDGDPGRRASIDPVQAGQAVGEFQLVAKVGQGAHGSVFLARDLSLGRYVAVKISPTRGQEGQVLARLNHPHIVSVYREQIVGASKLLAMQFVVGRNLQDWIRAVAGQDRSRFDCRAFARWAGEVEVPKQLSEDQSRCELPEGDYVAISVWLIQTVAEALQHAHRRGVLHHDIKPANIMIDRSGNPLLTDFNVASLSEDARRTTVGGTITYMSPEHLQTLLACMVEGSPRQQEAIDVRADIYSLAVVLYELLTGNVHWQPLRSGTSVEQVTQLLADRQLSGPPSLHALSGVTPALAAILAKSLHPEPNHRYQDASEFATDLGCWLHGQSNRFAANPSLQERGIRFARRHRRLLSVSLLAVGAVAFLLGAVLWKERSRLRACQQLAITANQELSADRTAGAAEQLGRAESLLSQVVWLPYFAPADYRRAADELSDVSWRIGQAELQRFRSQFGEIRLTAMPHKTPSDSSDLIKNALLTYGVMQREDWQSRSPFSDLDLVDQAAVAENISELLLVSILQSSSQARPAPDQLAMVMKRFPVQHRGLAIIHSLADGPQATFEIDAPHCNAVEDSFEAYLYGVVFMLQDDYQTAQLWFDHSILLRQTGTPPRFWAHYWNAFACQSQNQSDEALIHYGICVGLHPDFSWPLYNMGLVCWDKQDRELAKESMRKAIRINQRFGPAYVSLGAMLMQEHAYDGAVEAYERAIELGFESPEIYKHLALARRELGQRTGALRDIRKAAELVPGGP